MRKRYFLLLVMAISVMFSSYANDNSKKTDLIELENFGDNLGNLKSYYYKPKNATSGMPMVVVLHGCTQNVSQLVAAVDWNSLADQYGFYVLYPEQKMINNASKCFNWFQSKDCNKNEGENASIMNMVKTMSEKFKIDSTNVFITGMSAGAGMSMIMVANYPSVFKAASIMSGGPYLSATGLSSSYKAMKGKIQKTPEEWGNLVRLANPNYQGKYADLIVFHGKKDNVVNFKNSQEIIKQWSNVQGVDLTKKIETFPVEDVKRIDYIDSNGEVTLSKVEISNMGHALAIDKKMEIEKPGIFLKEKAYSSVYWSLDFFKLIP